MKLFDKIKKDYSDTEEEAAAAAKAATEAATAAKAATEAATAAKAATEATEAAEKEVKNKMHQHVIKIAKQKLYDAKNNEEKLTKDLDEAKKKEEKINKKNNLIRKINNERDKLHDNDLLSIIDCLSLKELKDFLSYLKNEFKNELINELINERDLTEKELTTYIDGQIAIYQKRLDSREKIKFALDDYNKIVQKLNSTYLLCEEINKIKTPQNNSVQSEINQEINKLINEINNTSENKLIEETKRNELEKKQQEMFQTCLKNVENFSVDELTKLIDISKWLIKTLKNFNIKYNVEIINDQIRFFDIQKAAAKAARKTRKRGGKTAKARNTRKRGGKTQKSKKSKKKEIMKKIRKTRKH